MEKKKTSFGPYFGPFGLNLDKKFNLWILPPLDSRNCCKLPLYAISRKTNEINVQIWAPIFFFVNFTSTRCYTLLQAINVCHFKEN